MKTVFLSELSLSRKYTLQQIIIGIVVSVALAIGMSNIYCIVPIIGVTITFSQAFTWIAIDEQNGWERYRAALPLTRSQIIEGRMLAILVRMIIVIALGVVLQCILSLIAPWLVEMLHVDPSGYEFDALYIMLTVSLTFLITTILIGLTVPFAARFGMTRAFRFIPLGFAALVILAICFLGGMPGEEMIAQLEVVIESGLLMVNAIILLVGVAIFALSTFASVIFYQRRQF